MEKIMLKTGLTSVSFRSVDAFDVIEYCKNCGIGAIEWGSDVHVPCNDRENAKKIKNACDDAGIEVTSYGSYYRCGTGEDYKETFAQYLAVAKILDAKTVRIWVGDRNYEDADVEYIEKIVSELKDICHMAEKESIAIGCEFHGGTLCNNRRASLDMVSRVDCDNFGMYFQYDPRMSREENLATLESFLPLLKNVHVFYVDSEFKRFSLATEDAQALWTQFIGILRENGAQTNLIFEFLPTESEECLAQEAKAFGELLAEKM